MEVNIKVCQRTEKERRVRICKAGFSLAVINIVKVIAHLSIFKGFQKNISFYDVVSFSESVN